MSNEQIARITMRRLSIPFKIPYWSMISTLSALDTLIAEVQMDNGRIGYGEAAIINGYTPETMQGGWQFCLTHSIQLIGKVSTGALAVLKPHRHDQSHAVTCLTSALEMACQHPLLRQIDSDRRVPVVGAVQGHDAAGLPTEVETLLAAGFRTLKVKVGTNVQTDLARVELIRKLVAGAAVLRLDANQGYSQQDACAFASALPADGIELFEQGCQAGDWIAAKAITAVSSVPTMLDESIFDMNDIDRAAEQQAAALIKLKLVKCGGISALYESLGRVHTHGMDSVLGNGVSGEIGNWMETCIAHNCVTRTGEMNGFTRPEARLFSNPLILQDGEIVLPANYYPEIDCDTLEYYTVQKAVYNAD